jgi:hypothetical protein
MNKNADLDPNLQLRLLMLGSLATSALTGVYLHKRLRDSLDKTPNSNPAVLSKIYQSAGIDKDFPTIPVPKLENAFYASPYHAKAMQRVTDLSPEVKAKIKELGYIAYDPKYNKAGIMAHEAGHAAMRTTKPWYHPTRMNQSWFRPIGDAMLPLSGTAGVVTGMATHNPLYGALAGFGSAALLGAPTLINEAQATGYAKRYLDQSTHREDTRNKNRDALNKAYSTYAIGTLLHPTLVGGLSGAWADHMNVHL